MDSSHDAPAPSRGGRGDLSDDSLRDVIDQIQSRMDVDGEAAVGPKETDSNKQHSEAAPADDGGAKKSRRVDISPAGGGHSGGGSVGAGGAAAATQQQQGGATKISSRSSDLDSPVINNEAVRCIFGGSRVRLLKVKDVGSLRMAARHHSLVDYPLTALRTRLTHSLHHKLLADGTRLDTVLVFDAQTVSEPGVVLAAMWLVEEQTWDEVAEVLRWAEQCGRCKLPVKVTAANINKHADKTAYVSLPRVLAQLMVVGRRVRFKDGEGQGSRLKLFRHGHEVRAFYDKAIEDEADYRLLIDAPVIEDEAIEDEEVIEDEEDLDDGPLPAGHLYEQHRLEHDPPVRSRNYWDEFDGGFGGGGFGNRTDDASASSWAKRLVLNHFEWKHHWRTYCASIDLNRRVGGGRLDSLLTQSPHTPVAGCTTTFSSDGCVRYLVLTDSSHDFVAWLGIEDLEDGTVEVLVKTTEAAVSKVPGAVGSREMSGGAFKDCFPVTTRLARVALGRVAPYIFDGQVDDDSGDNDDSDGHGGDWDDLDDDSDGEHSGGDNASEAEEENGD
ncbi:unnamed protein product [Vitrella brassicaformis CCMP3155]|uniref:Uncharacterized protein n=1 Tax=Vitrella brassicaformis (strain CCMP3155) TaxID=1169540 RepID=A0A0G4GLZ9_VITBC|nr:unnamed protein product [Vitrella brassicaformis CCMP3155]|eukprot:CEM31157.1 unnamed protein product [Vitrella brassicaformis CCMP3155]